MKIEVVVNGKKRIWDANPGDTVLDLLRGKETITSVRDGCDRQGTCGVCSVLLDGKLVNSCLLLAPQVDGKNIVTVEGLTKARELHPIQDAFLEAGIVQCGYCTPSMVLAVKSLLDKTLDPTKEEIKDTLSGIFCRCTGYEQFFDAIKLAAKKIKDESASENFNPSFAEELKVIGKAKRKVDGIVLAKGQSAYVEDKVKPNSLYVKMLRSPHAHAIIKNIDTSEAENVPGVEYILTHKNAPQKRYSSAGQGFPEPSPYDKRLIDEKVRFVGDRVAAVAATSLEASEEAIKKIKVEYEVLEAALTVDDARKQGAPIIQDYDVSTNPLHIGADPTKNIAAHNADGIGDADKALAEAEFTIERVFKTTPIQCTPLEPHVVYTHIENDRLVVHASTQVPWHMRRVLASILDIKENRIRVIKEKIGGGFGAKQDIVVEDIASWITWQTGKPVFFRMTREEEFIASRLRHPMQVRIKAGLKKDGTITALDMEVLANTGPYGVHALTVPMNACSKSLALFKCEDVKYSVTAYYTNYPISGAYQGYGAPQGSFAVQMTLAEASDQLGLDFYELLRKNHVTPGYKLEILKCLGEGQEGIAQKISTCALAEALEKGKELIGLDKKEVSENPDVKIGKAAVIIQQGSGLPGIDAANAIVKMLADGTFMLLIGGTDLGTGLDTMAAKMVAECLEIDVEQVAVTSADTDTTPFDVGSYASSGTYFTGSAALGAAKKMREEILVAAAEILGEERDKLTLASPMKVQSTSGKEVSYAKIAAVTQSGTGKGQLITSAGFTIDDAPIPYGAHFAQVSINTKTGELVVDKYYAIHDSGTPINPELTLGQVYGGVLKSIGHTLYEELVFDEKGTCLNPTLLDYKVPMINDLPNDFQVHMINTNDPLGPYGAKSIAEISTNGAAPVIGIAIHDALGIWLREWPLNAEKILAELKKQKEG